jgi:F0F1-type ATP synthase assembly protein I
MPASPAPGSSRAPSKRAELGSSLVGLDQGWTMGSEMLVGILLLSGLGWLADEALGSTPWLFAVGALAGFGCGLYLVILRAQRMDEKERAGRGHDGV